MLLALFACGPAEQGAAPSDDSAPVDTGEDIDDTADPEDSDLPGDSGDSAAPGDSGDSATPAGEAFAAYLTSTTDLCAYEDGDIVTFEPDPPPDGYIDPGWVEPYLPCLDGLLWLTRSVVDYDGGRDERADATATFFQLETVEQMWLEGEWLDEQDGTDDCGLARMGRNGLGTESDIVWLDPGSVSLETADGWVPMDRQEGGFVLNWGLDFAKAGVTPDETALYGLDAGGSKGVGKWGPFAGIELDDIVALPAELEITSPTLGDGVEIDRADTELQWTKGGDGTVTIEIVGETPMRIFDLRCKATDDGSFTIPGDLLDQLPAGLEVTLTMTRLDDVWVGTTAGRSFHAMGMSLYGAFGMSVP